MNNKRYFFLQQTTQSSLKHRLYVVLSTVFSIFFQSALDDVLVPIFHDLRAVPRILDDVYVPAF